MRLLAEADAEELHALIVANREHLARWMPWAGAQTLAGTRSFLAGASARLARGDGYDAAILANGSIVGVAGFHYVSWTHRATSLGYWLAASEQGRGTMTAAVAALLRQSFAHWALHRVEIRAALGNARSRAVPLRLGFRQEGVLREVELLREGYVDHAVYALLEHEWRGRAAG